MKRTIAAAVVVAAIAGCSGAHDSAPSTVPTPASQATTPAERQQPASGMWAEDEPDWQIEMAAWDDLPVIDGTAELVVEGLPVDPSPSGEVTDLRVEVFDEVAIWDVPLPLMGPDDAGHVARLSPWTVTTETSLPVLETVGHDDNWGLIPVIARSGLPGDGVTGQAVGWIHLADPAVEVVRDEHRIVVDTAGETVTILDGDTVLHEAAVAVGRPGNATPRGRSAIVAAFEDPSATYADGELLALSRFSDDLDAFTPMGATGPVAPLIGFHLWRGTEPTGRVSNGCVRVVGSTHAVLLGLPIGTPVHIT